MTHSHRTYWRTLQELAEQPEFAELVEREVPRFRNIVQAFDRRRFLQLMAASMALGGLTGCGPEVKQRQRVPYVEQPENVVPGRNRYYTGAVLQDGYANGVLVAHEMARPFKVEGNPDHPASLGAASAIMQASILELYDPRRAQTMIGNGQIVSWESVIGALHARRDHLLARKGEGLRVLTGAVTSPSLSAQLAKLQQEMPGMRWHRWQPLHRDNELEAARRSFGQPADRVADVSKAQCILAIESDLISSAPGWLAHARRFAAARRPAETGGKMSRVYAFESTPTLLGAKADHRLAMPPGEIVACLRYLAGSLEAGPQAWSEAEPAHAEFLKALADDLKQNKGSALVHAGPEQPVEVHLLVDALNGALGAIGSTLKLIAPVETGASSMRASLADLVADMGSGQVDTLLVMGTNPAYDAPPEFEFAAHLPHVPFSLALSLYEDETAVACKWRVPAAHDFETWSDARAFDGTVTIMQPQIRPLQNGRAAQEIVGAMLGDLAPDPYKIVRVHWQEAARDRGDFETFWHQAIQSGVVSNTASPALSVQSGQSAAADLGKAAKSGDHNGLVALFRPDEGTWDGRHADNPWLLEMARAFTRLTWDNAALVAPATADRLGLKTEDVVEISIGNSRQKAPVFVLPGQAPDCVTLPLGWGRSQGGLGAGVGFSAYALRHADRPWTAPIASLTKTGETYRLAKAQGADRVLGRDLVREADLAQFNADPHAIVEQKKPMSLYGPFKYPDRAWAMQVDLNSCIGCQACTIACQAENNVPVVGKDQVLSERIMHWLRIDRYYSGSPEQPDVAFEPMPCMHCEQAPCEVVCPVHATVHDHEGLNLMVYNRCVGTRFCSNNCPYKVRRFNFFGYAGANQRDPKSWNPDVTVRDRGVMEKCTYCIQRIRKTQIDAARDDREIADGEVQTACQQSCPTQAIVFGDRNKHDSEVARRKAWPIDYNLLDDLNTSPRTTYGALIRNPNPAIKIEKA